MQELNVQPSIPTPYTPAGGTYNNNPIPGAGGLPSLSGLNSRINPMAQELQQQGRGEDSMLVHMTPNEVNSLRGLAQKFGGDLTTNPSTGLPEAGWLGKLLPTLIGAAGMLIPGVAPWMLAAGVGVGQTALTGDLNKGLMAGLQAFGGASLAGAAGVGGGAATAGAPEAAVNLSPGAATPTLSVPADIAAMAAPTATPTLTNVALQGAPSLGGTIAAQAPQTLLAPGMGAPATPGFFSEFGAAASKGLPKGMLSKYAPYAAGLGTLSAVSDATAPDLKKYEEEEDKWKYEGPYYPMPRRISPRANGPDGMGEISFFDVTNPVGYLTASGERRGYAEGGSTSGEKPQEMSVPNTGGGAPTGLALSNVPKQTAFAWELAAKPVAERQTMDQFAGDANAYRLMTEGIVDSQGRRGQFSGTSAATMEPGAVQQFGDTYMKLGDDRRWYTTTAPPPPPPPGGGGPGVTTAGTFTGGNITPDMGGVTPGGGTGATLTTPTLTPGATQSGFGVETLKDVYTPNFTQKADYVTPKTEAYTLGSQLAAALPQFTSMFQTSPGAITASRGYEGGSPSERIRAAAQANAVKPTNEIDFGLPKTSAINTTAYTASGLPDFTTMTPQDIFNYYNRTTTNTTTSPAGPRRAHGGSIHMDDGSFVVDARTVSELGNGSSNAGIEFLERLGGRAVRGPGDGVSDSVRANIGGKQEARVARDEVIFPSAAVKRLGGAKKLYALMDKAHKARKKAKRGQDTKIAKGLGALA